MSRKDYRVWEERAIYFRFQMVSGRRRGGGVSRCHKELWEHLVAKGRLYR